MNLTWMAWTWPTAALFIFVFASIATMGVVEWRSPGGAPRRGILGLDTTRGDRLFISTGYGGRSARGALFQLGEGQPQQIWLNQDLETKMNSAVVYEGHVYCISEKSRKIEFIGGLNL